MPLEGPVIHTSRVVFNETVIGYVIVIVLTLKICFFFIVTFFFFFVTSVVYEKNNAIPFAAIKMYICTMLKV